MEDVGSNRTITDRNMASQTVIRAMKDKKGVTWKHLIRGRSDLFWRVPEEGTWH